MTVSSVLILGAYLLGSVSSAIIVCRLMRLPDPRELGSGNPGATNVLRTGSKVAAGVTLVGDAVKGYVPVLTAQYFGVGWPVIGCVALVAVVGHMYPVFFGFKGGKGVATALGAYIGMNWVLGVLWGMTWLLVALITRYSSLSALVATALIPFYAYWFTQSIGLTGAVVGIAILIFYHHRGNIRNLLDGAESKIGQGT